MEVLTYARGMQALNLTEAHWAWRRWWGRWEGRDETEKMP